MNNPAAVAARTPLLLISADPDVGSHLTALLPDFRVVAAAESAEALAVLRRENPPVVVLDVEAVGLGLIRSILSERNGTKVVALVGEGKRELAARAVGCGAADFYHRPLESEVLPLILRRARRIQELEEQNQRLRGRVTGAMVDAGLVGSSDPMRATFRMVEKLAPARATVLILGESGTGKELLARALHNLSDRAKGPFCAINCAAIPESLLESELFGHERGAFTGAVRQSQGRLELAAGGTVFLDEIAEMPAALQAKLLRVLQERVVERVGGKSSIPLDIRVVCATNKDLQALIASQEFREDLYYRINEVSVHVPPLRERQGDAVLLARHFLSESLRRNPGRVRGFSSAALRAIEEARWPGNVRELQNRVNSAVIMAETSFISAEDLGLSGGGGAAAHVTLRDVRRAAERGALQRALAAAEGNLSRAAALLDITRPTLYDLIARLDVNASEYNVLAAKRRLRLELPCQ
jgi:two-component system NtrC family response regulator